MREWLDGLLAVLLAPTCATCARPLAAPTRGCVCADCWARLEPSLGSRCRRCGDATRPATPLCGICRRSSSAVARTCAIGPYAGVLRDIIQALKYDGRRSLARPLGVRMRQAGAALLADAEMAVPVPLHPARHRARGFNQAADLARHLGLPVVHALERTRYTESQTALPAVDRHANVAGAFRIARRWRRLRATRVVLVDDVRTTGATLEACARVLKEAGVGDVCGLTAARVETPVR